MPRGVYPRSDQCKHCVNKDDCAKTNSFLPEGVACLSYYYNGEA